MTGRAGPARPRAGGGRSLGRRAADLLYASPIYPLTLRARPPGALAFQPAEPWPGDRERGARILAGSFLLAGETETAGPDLWPRARVPDGWSEAFHGFGWLGDLHAVGTDAARRRARELIAGWIDRFGRWEAVAWRPETLARRTAAWLAHYGFYEAGAEAGFSDRLLRSLDAQARHLARVAPGREDGITRLRIAKALVYAGLALGRARVAREGGRLLDSEIARQVLPDGGHVARNPAAQLVTLRLLAEMRAAFVAAGAETPLALDTAIDRMAPALRALRHGDGGLALFNGACEMEPWLVDAVLGQAAAPGKAPDSLAHSGFQRLAAGRTLIIADAGPPPPPGFDRDAHAGTLSFEMSVGKERLIVNCGAHAGAGSAWHAAQRASAAHSTLVVGDTNSAEIAPDGGLGRRPREVTWRREAAAGLVLLELGHDGYLGPYGVVHRRRLYLARGGDDLRGEDSLIGPGEHEATVRFHLHPEVRASLVQTGDGALLRLPGGAGWRFQVAGAAPRLEESIYLGRGGELRRTEQIVVTTRLERAGAPLKWALRRIDQP